MVLTAAGVVLLGLAAWLVGAFTSGIGSFRTEGSPAGTIAFVFFLGGAFTAAVFGLTCLVSGLALWRRGGPPPPIPRALWLFAVAGTAVLMAVGYFRGTGEADQAAAESASGPTALRLRYDECVRRVRDWQQTETLKECADELIVAWDESHLLKRKLAGMPETRELASRLGSMYATYGKGARDLRGGIEGLRSLREKVDVRLPRDKELQSSLLRQEQDLRGALGRM